MKRNSTVRDIQSVFSAFDDGSPDKISKNLRTLFRVCVYLIVGFPIGLALEKVSGDRIIGQAGSILAIVAAIAWFISIIFLILMGAHTYGKKRGSRSLAFSMFLVLGKTFKYVLLPAIIFTILLVIWAVITKQPTFQ